MNEALSTAQACIAGAMEALASAGVADAGRAAEDDVSILRAQTLLRRALSDLASRFDGGPRRQPAPRLLMDSLMLEAAPAASPDVAFTLHLPEPDAGGARPRIVTA